jgi:5'-deoxynucleotidase
MIHIRYDFKKNAFFALARRVRNIFRWSLMHNITRENVGEHSHEVAIFAHGIAATGVTKFGKQYCPNKIATIAVYHEISESVLGDQPSTLKHANEETSEFFRKIEEQTERDMVATLPEYLQDYMANVAVHSRFSLEEAEIVKAADIMSMLLKCDREIQLGNNEFSSAKDKLSKRHQYFYEKYPEVKEFCDLHLTQCKLTIDGLVSL